MKFTNNLNLPSWLYEVIVQENNKYSKGEADISTTQLIDAPLQRLLKKRHFDEIVVDVSSLLWSFYGNLAHTLFSLVESKDIIFKEQRFFIEVDGWTISGQPDLYWKDGKDKVLTDFKFPRAFAFKKGVKREYIRQINVYNYILGKHDFPVDRLQVMAWFRDADYQTDDITIYPVKMYSNEKTEKYIKGRVAFHKLCENELTGTIPECTQAERWQDPDKFCVMKEGNERQSGKDYVTEEEAIEAMTEMSMKHTIEKYYVKRKHQRNKRCENYCTVSKFCWWWNDYKEGYITNSYREDGKPPERVKFKDV